MTPTAQRKLRDALMGAKVNVTNDELDSWDAWRDHCDVNPAPWLVSTPYSARTFEAWNKASGEVAYCSRCADTVRGATPSDAFLCPFCWSLDREQIAGWADSSPSLYLSVSSGRWRVIHRGSSVCADGDEATARAVFRRYRVAGMAAPLWNGDEARWEIAPEVR